MQPRGKAPIFEFVMGFTFIEKSVAFEKLN